MVARSSAVRSAPVVVVVAAATAVATGARQALADQLQQLTALVQLQRVITSADALAVDKDTRNRVGAGQQSESRLDLLAVCAVVDVNGSERDLHVPEHLLGRVAVGARALGKHDHAVVGDELTDEALWRHRSAVPEVRRHGPHSLPLDAVVVEGTARRRVQIVTEQHEACGVVGACSRQSVCAKLLS